MSPSNGKDDEQVWLSLKGIYIPWEKTHQKLENHNVVWKWISRQWNSPFCINKWEKLLTRGQGRKNFPEETVSRLGTEKKSNSQAQKGIKKQKTFQTLGIAEAKAKHILITQFNVDGMSTDLQRIK